MSVHTVMAGFKKTKTKKQTKQTNKQQQTATTKYRSVMLINNLPKKSYLPYTSIHNVHAVTCGYSALLQ